MTKTTVRFQKEQIASALRGAGLAVRYQGIGLFLRLDVQDRWPVADTTIKRIAHAYGGRTRFERDAAGRSVTCFISRKPEPAR